MLIILNALFLKTVSEMEFLRFSIGSNNFIEKSLYQKEDAILFLIQ